MRANILQKLMLLAFLAITLVTAGAMSAAAQQQAAPPPSKFKLMSPAYTEGSMIPHAIFLRGPERQLTGVAVEQSASGRTELRRDLPRFRRRAEQRVDGRDALDLLEHSGELDRGPGGREGGRIARRDRAGQKHSRREW